MNASQQAALNKLYDELPGHDVSERSAPSMTLLHCKCGWRSQIFARNALARASKTHHAIRKHLLDMAEYHGVALGEQQQTR